MFINSAQPYSQTQRLRYGASAMPEYLLYRHIYLSVYSSPDQSITRASFVHRLLFRTLTSNPQKAALLRSFHFQFADAKYGTYDKTAGQITEALRDAHGLVDLRIAFNGHSGATKEKLDVAIKSGYFQLRTLYSNSFRDLEGIIVSQKHLRLFGIDYGYDDYYCNYSELVKNVCHSRIDNERELPDIFMFRTGGYWGLGDIVRLTLFPELCRPGQAFTLCRDIAMSLRRNLCKRYHVVTYCSFEIHIFDFTHAEAATICKVVEGMAQYIVRCEIFTMRVQGKGLKPWRIPGLLTSASQLRQLRRLTFNIRAAR
ncbi:hypothetical protein M378DRAFT_9583 [Amanita muscaria Koide BX008]|uniref:Uncharacterized protein n=1 Tax=Amanita muscaria (strain Koide BX008) TaxID=946122 RepID=A0A0C2WZV3_AMAMK|nr:hypothetical protein M378DRAFT_9583 [Amanita muscaria Koide BX008]